MVWVIVAGLAVACAAVALGTADNPSVLRPGIEARYPDIAWVDTASLARWLQRPPPRRPVLLDTRSRAEFAVSHLAGALRVDPDRPGAAVPHLGEGVEVVVYCSVGLRSARVVAALGGRSGRVKNLEGGIFAWANEGRPLYSDDRRVGTVHEYDALWGWLLDARRHGRR